MIVSSHGGGGKFLFAPRKSHFPPHECLKTTTQRLTLLPFFCSLFLVPCSLFPVPYLAMLLPLLVGIGTLLVTVTIQSGAAGMMIEALAYAKRRGVVGTGFVRDSLVLSSMLLIVLLGNLIQMAIWALVFMLCGQFENYETAFYFSAVNFTTLGYGDITLSSRWRILGPLEAANGVLMFGLSAAMAYAVMAWLFQSRLQKIDHHPEHPEKK